MPTTGTPEPGGLGWYETLTFIRKLAEKKRVVGMDLVEYSYVENYDSPGVSSARNWFTNPSPISFDDETPKITAVYAQSLRYYYAWVDLS